MFRLAGYADDEKGELYRYLSSIASKVIYNALDVWGGDIPAIMDVYLTEFAGTPESVSETVFFAGISEYISQSIVRSGIHAAVDRTRYLRASCGEDGRIGMELLARKIIRMKEKMADPDNYYTFDLFEEFLFAKMIDSYDPAIFEGDEDPFIFTTDDEVKKTAERLFTEFKVGEEIEAELEEDGIGRKYADWLARTVHRLDKMSIYASEDAGFDSLFFWDMDYEIAFPGTFVDGIRSLVSGTAAILGYGYKDVQEIFTDIGIKAPLLLVGTEAAFDTVGEITQERVAEVMNELPLFSDDFDIKKKMKEDGITEDDLPFS